MTARPLRRRLATLLLAALAVGLDQLSKGWAVEHLATGTVQPLLPGLLQLQRVSNTGAAFSLFAGAPNQLGLVSALVSLGLLFWILWRPPAGLWSVLALGLLLGGAVGNGIDRWRQGAVVDFLEFVPIDFPIFNLADVAINLAVACFLIDLLRPHAERHP
ncbi:signal peptidase II [Microcystis elabens FACHB-917]|nr:signal peptidase II [Microcystis elabens FACHB-917]